MFRRIINKNLRRSKKIKKKSETNIKKIFKKITNKK